MKLSDIKGERAIEVVADIMPFVTNIVMDRKGMPESVTLAVSKDDPEAAQKATQDFFHDGVPWLVKNHKADIVGIISAVKDVDPKKYTEDASWAVVLSDVYELFSDPTFLALFL